MKVFLRIAFIRAGSVASINARMTTTDSLQKLLSELSSKRFRNYGNDFLLTWEKSREQLEATLLVAEILRELYTNNLSAKLFESGVAVSWFRDKSTRTRYSFQSAANLLGLTVQDFDEEQSQITHGEAAKETATMISFLTEVIGIRDDQYLGEGHTFQKQVASAVQEGFKEGILPQRPSVLNLQCDRDHPTQSMSDLLHLKKKFEGLSNLQGKKIVMSWAYSPSYGKPLSVAQGICALLTRFGMDVVLAYPQGYNLIPELERLCAKQATKSGGHFRITHNMAQAFADADIVYPKSWAPYGIMFKRTRLLKKGDTKGLLELERQALAQNAKHQDWECNEKMMKLTKNGRALYLHCLPADVSGVNSRKGEVEQSVFERYRFELFKQAGYKPYIIAAMILLSKFEKPKQVLRTLLNRRAPRLMA